MMDHLSQGRFERIEPHFSWRERLSGLISWRDLVWGTLWVVVGFAVAMAAIIFYAGVLAR